MESEMTSILVKTKYFRSDIFDRDWKSHLTPPWRYSSLQSPSENLLLAVLSAAASPNAKWSISGIRASYASSRHFSQTQNHHTSSHYRIYHTVCADSRSRWPRVILDFFFPRSYTGAEQVTDSSEVQILSTTRKTRTVMARLRMKSRGNNIIIIAYLLEIYTDNDSYSY